MYGVQPTIILVNYQPCLYLTLSTIKFLELLLKQFYFNRISNLMRVFVIFFTTPATYTFNVRNFVLALVQCFFFALILRPK